MKKLPYGQGTCFLVPLREGGYAVGVVARLAPRGKVILIYLFGPMHSSPPSLEELNKLRSSDAIKCVRAGDLGIINGEWKIIGNLANWDPREWPMPEFYRQEQFSNRTWRVLYSDTDPSFVEREELAPNTSTELESAALRGYGSVELLLTKLLASQH